MMKLLLSTAPIFLLALATPVASRLSSSASRSNNETTHEKGRKMQRACQVGPAADPSMSCRRNNRFCKLETGVCNNKSGIQSGTCATSYQQCPMIFQPVCGCDGATYGNECEAHSKGINVSYQGECIPATVSEELLVERQCEIGPGASKHCSGGEFCALKSRSCPSAKNRIFQGTCVALGSACPMLYNPMCGCDGNTYSNKCVAQTNGVNMDYKGECRKEPV